MQTTTLLDFSIPPIPSRAVQRLDAGLTATVYVSGSTALQNFMKPMGVTAYFIGVTGRREHLRRIANRRELAHGSILADPDNPYENCIQLPCGQEHFISPIRPTELDQTKLPDSIALKDGVFNVLLPPGINSTDFDNALARVLEPRSLNHYLDSMDGQERMRQVGYDPRHRLYTDYRMIGEKPRRSLVIEAYVIRPRVEAEFILAAIQNARITVSTGRKL